MIPNYFPNDPRVYLREELELRKRRRPHYSMRAFARDLEMSPSFLCEFLAGRQGLSRERVSWIARRLDFSNEQGEHFWDLIEARFGRTQDAKRAARLRVGQRLKNTDARMSLERFQFISEWYHFAIVEILLLPGPQRSEQDLARILDISQAKVTSALKRLRDLELIEPDPGNAERPWLIKSEYTFVGDEGADRAIQLAHQQMLMMHTRAIETRAVEDRHSLSVVFSMNNASFTEFSRELREAVVNVLSRFADDAKPKDQVTCLSLQALKLLEEPAK